MTFNKEVAELERRITDEVFKLLEATPPSFEEALKQIAGVVSVQLLEAEPALMRRWGETDAELRGHAVRTIAPESLVVRVGNFVCEEPASGEYIGVPAPVPSMVFIPDKLPDAAPALPAVTRTGTAPCGPQKARLVPCSKSIWHKHHPENEACPECDGPDVIKVSIPQKAVEWWCSRTTGLWRDEPPPPYAGANRFRIAHAGYDSTDAKIACGCVNGRLLGGCTYYTKYDTKRGTIHQTSVCKMPSVVEDPEWKKDRP